MSTRSYYEFALRPCRMPNAGQGWAELGQTNRAYACCVRNIRRGESNHLPVAAAAGTPGSTATVASCQLPVIYSSQLKPSSPSSPPSLPLCCCLALVVLVLLLCFWLTLARLAAFWLAFFKTSRDTLAHTHTQQTQKKDIVNSVGVFFAFAEHNNCNH